MTLHDSETVVGRVTRARRLDQRYGERRLCGCGQTHGRVKYAHPVQPSPDAASIGEFVAATLVLLLLFGALFIGVPVIFAVLEGRAA